MKFNDQRTTRISMNNLQICDSPFWNVDLFWKTDKPRLTACFEQSVLAVAPSAVLFVTWICTLIVRRYEGPVSANALPRTLLYVVKLISSAALIVCSLSELAYFAYQNAEAEQPLPLVGVISPLVQIAALSLAMALQMKQRQDGQLSSNVLFLFWFLSLACAFLYSPIFELLTGTLDEFTDSGRFILLSFSFPLICVQFVISAFSDPSYSLIWQSATDEYVMEHQPPLSRLLFSWLNRLLMRGYRHELTVDDIDPLPRERKSEHLSGLLSRNWRISKQKHSARSLGDSVSFTRALIKSMWKWILAAAILELAYDILILLPPLIMDSLIEFTQKDDIPYWHGFVFASALLISSAACTVISQHNLNYLILSAFVPKVGATAAIYRKTLRMSNLSKSRYTAGELCNLIAVDTQALIQFVFYCNLLWSLPLRTVLTIALLWQYLGWTCLVGVAVTLIILPITAYLARNIQRLQKLQMKDKDSRLRQMNDILNGIKILKLFAWEKSFMKQISDIRSKEVDRIRKMALINAVIAFFWTITPFLVAIASFVAFVLVDENNILDPVIAFVSLTLFNQLGLVLSFIPDVVSDFIQCRISLKRIEKFFKTEELNDEDVGADVAEGECIVLDHCTLAWSSGEAPFLNDVTLTVPEGSLVAVVGQVGSGKSALLSAILGEMHKVSGSIRVKKGDIAFVAQQAWIQNATVQENILFTRKMSSSLYRQVLQSCCLTDDLKILPEGDYTEIGEKGVNLSGGQKQRISLARALYHDADTYLLDDPLSAVDAHVGAHIFNQVVGPKGALRKKTRILVTHDLSILPEMDLIVVLSNGRVEEVGPYQELMNRKGQFSRYVEEHQKKGELANESTSENIRSTSEDARSPEAISGQPTFPLTTAGLKEQMKRRGCRISRTLSTQISAHKKKRLIEKENMESGRVRASVFLTYFRYASYMSIALMLLAFIVSRVFEVSGNYWLSLWSSDPVSENHSLDIRLRNLRMAVYGLLGVGQGLSIFVASFFLAFASTRAATTLHSEFLASIFRSPMAFFETTPVGRILNRFGKDINIVDANIPMALSTVLTNVVAVMGTVAVIAANSAIFIGILLILSIFYYFIQSYYLETSRQVRRLHSTTLSPVMSNFSETVEGTLTIRAFRAERYFIGKEDKLVDENARIFYSSTLLNRWLSTRLELLGSVLVFSVALLAVLDRSSLSAGMAGLTLTYAMSITSTLAVFVKSFVNLEIRMVSVERIAEYCELPPEARWESNDEESLPIGWPHSGSIVFNEYQMRYHKELSLVLKGINLQINPGEKVGVVGRTGAGKSSLALALLRIVEPAGGAILIDGVDIAKLGLHELRSRITIIPQDPVLFSGTIRSNLDPAHQCQDDRLWEALEHAHLKGFVISLEGGLDFAVFSGGGNLSVGQRQQLCLARALLKKTQVLILDEATAAVDMETDSLIQSTIRREFDSCTVITIAHRLYTILDYDRIIVMDNGHIVEEGPPDHLLQMVDSNFFKLSKDAGLV